MTKVHLVFLLLASLPKCALKHTILEISGLS